MSISETIKDFNTILGDFLQQLSPILGTSTYHFYFTKLIKANAILPLQYFNHFVFKSEKPLDEYILTRNEEYFTNTENHVEDIKNYDGSLMEIIRLKGIYEKLDDKSKENVWSILQILLTLSKHYLQLKK
jgi:hypothetical protein